MLKENGILWKIEVALKNVTHSLFICREIDIEQDSNGSKYKHWRVTCSILVAAYSCHTGLLSLPLYRSSYWCWLKKKFQKFWHLCRCNCQTTPLTSRCNQVHLSQTRQLPALYKIPEMSCQEIRIYKLTRNLFPQLKSISENMDLCWSLRMSIQTGIYFISISVGGRRGDVFIEIFQFWRESDKSFYCTRSNLSQFVWICFLFKPLPSENPLFVFFVAPRKHSLTS